LVLQCDVEANITADNPTYCGVVHSNVKYKLVADTEGCRPRRVEDTWTYKNSKQTDKIFCR